MHEYAAEGGYQVVIEQTDLLPSSEAESEFDVLVVMDYSRISRDPGTLARITEELSAAGITIETAR